MTTRTLTLADFLAQRIAETEALLVNSVDEVEYLGNRLVDARTLVRADAAAKRRIIELHREWPVLVETEPTFDRDENADPDSMTFRMSKQIAWTTEQKYREHFGSEPPTGPILRALAAVYADHPDYRAEWRVSR